MKVQELVNLPHQHLSYLVKENGLKVDVVDKYLDREISCLECASIIEHTVIINIKAVDK